MTGKVGQGGVGRGGGLGRAPPRTGHAIAPLIHIQLLCNEEPLQHSAFPALPRTAPEVHYEHIIKLEPLSLRHRQHQPAVPVERGRQVLLGRLAAHQDGLVGAKLNLHPVMCVHVCAKGVQRVCGWVRIRQRQAQLVKSCGGQN